MLRGSLPFGPFHFGERFNQDYSHKSAPAFSGAFIELFGRTPEQAKGMLEAASDHDMRVVVNIANGNPCTYWDGRRFDLNALVADASPWVDLVASYYPETILGVMMLNEPHDPTACDPVPARMLYRAAEEIRKYFAKHDIGDIPLGFNTPPKYIFDNIPLRRAQDGTITLSYLPWANRPEFDSFTDWAMPHQNAAESMSAEGNQYWICYSVNSNRMSDTDMLMYLAWAADQPHALQLWWYRWGDEDGPKKTVSLEEWQTIRDLCDDNIL